MDNKETRTFVRGAAILGVSGIICKILGAVYRIPLTNLIGTEAMGIYSKAYMIYALLLVLTASGMPAAVSKLVAEYSAAGDMRGARRILSVTRGLLVAAGSVCALIMLLLSDITARSLGITGGAMVIVCVAPSLLLMFISAYRGYFQGLQDMKPTAVSQIIGQLSKLVFGLSFAALFMPKGPVYAASGALLGVSASELLSLVYIALAYRRSKRSIPYKGVSLAGKSNKDIIRSLLLIAVPLTLGGAVMPLINTLDAYLVTWCMKLSGYSEQQINNMYGVLNGMVVSLANMPTALTLALSASLVPAISRARAKNNTVEISRTASLGLKLALLAGLPACAGLIMLARPVLELLYSTSQADQTALQSLTQTLFIPYRMVFMKMELAQSLMIIMCPAMLMLTSVQAMTGALQGAGIIYTPIRNLLIGAACKLAVSSALICIPSVNIMGAPIGTLVCYTVTACLDYIQLRRKLNAGINVEFLLKPLTATAVMTISLYFIKYLLGGKILNPLATVAAVIAGVLIYLLTLMPVKPFSVKEWALIRASKRIAERSPNTAANLTPPPESVNTAKNVRRRRERLGEIPRQSQPEISQPIQSKEESNNE